MSFTRFHDDPARIKRQIEISSNQGRYQLERPGPGADLPYFEDPRIRLQQWGANLRNNTTLLESELFGISRKMNKDGKYDSIDASNFSKPYDYSTQSSFIDESRTTLPAWTFREHKTERWDMSLHDSQSKEATEIPFETNSSTRISEKDQFAKVHYPDHPLG
jgi:hypothetical protein